MKLNTTQLAAIKAQTGADPVAEESDAHGTLTEAFGDHTFYVSEVGLLVPEPAAEVPETVETAPPEEPVELILVAEWADDNRQAMQRIEPKRTGYVLDAAAEDGGDAAG